MPGPDGAVPPVPTDLAWRTVGSATPGDPSVRLPVLEMDLLRDAQRQLEICNACRYCEGICAVFPAIERRRAFQAGDVLLLANLCHDCRTCYYVCPFTPPHQFEINIPRMMSRVREATYRGYAWPRWLAQFLVDQGPGLALILLFSLAVAVAASFLWAGPTALTSARTGPGAFYTVFPWLWMFVPATLLTVVGFAVAGLGVLHFWRDVGSSSAVRAAGARPLLGAIGDALTLRYLDGGGPGCDYPEESPSRARKWAHHLVFWGFAAAFVSTTLAFVQQEIFGVLPPYPYASAPVLFGAAGGIAMIGGGIALWALKLRSERAPASLVMFAKDQAFIALLLLVNVTGMALLLLRDTPGMGIMLNLHLAAVLGFYLTAPYGKLVHALYRTGALFRDRLERHAELTVGTAVWTRSAPR